MSIEDTVEIVTDVIESDGDATDLVEVVTVEKKNVPLIRMLARLSILPEGLKPSLYLTKKGTQRTGEYLRAPAQLLETPESVYSGLKELQY